MNFFRKIPIETYVLTFLPLLVGILALFLVGPNPYVDNYFQTFLYYLFFGGPFLFLALIILNVYFLFRILAHVGEGLVLGAEKNWKAKVKDILIAQVYFFSVLVFGLLLSSLLVAGLSSTADPDWIVTVSDALKSWDYKIFGIHPFIWLGELYQRGFGFSDRLLLWAYRSLTIVLSAFVILAAVVSREVFRRFLLFFFVVQFISFPVWYSLPALSPYNMYVRNILGVDINQAMQAEVTSYEPSPALISYLGSIDNSREDLGNYRDLTTLPSMHAAWGFGLAFFAIRLWAPLAVFFVPWAVLDMMGAVYTGQHYSLDILAGIFLAIISIALAGFLASFGRRYYRGRELLVVGDIIREDIKAFSRYLKLALGDFKSYLRSKKPPM